MATRMHAFGGVYSNHLALDAALADARHRAAELVWCLGDLGGFGPHPEKSAALLRANAVPMLQGNYDHSIGNSLGDCGCGYTDPRDNAWAQASYDYTNARVSEETRAWLRALPPRARLQIEGHRVLLCHGSPRQVNEFLWDSQCSDAFLGWMLRAFEADVILCTHTGLHWQRTLPGIGHVVNVGAIGRPAHDGRTHVWSTELDFSPGALEVRFRAIHYDHVALAAEMEAEALPSEFVETIRTGWWTTCLENVPSRERRAGHART